MFKIKKFILYCISIFYILLTIIELIVYLKTDSNIFGLVYLLMNVIIIFLLIPTVHNYKKYYSMARISKLIIIVLIGLFDSFLLSKIVLSNIAYIDSSVIYIDKIRSIKMVLKPILYLVLVAIIILEFKGEKVIKTISNKNID